MIEVGDLVKVGTGGVTWCVESFYGQDDQIAALAKVEPDGTVSAYVHTSAPVRRLTIVQKRVLA
jgi:hypothetical protein